MSAPVDVKAVLQDCAAFIAEKTGDPAAAADLHMVSDAFSELLEAAQEVTEATALSVEELKGFVRLIRAIANCKGEKA